MVGKTFDVEDGFLKKVRVAQFAPGRTRVVLEVDNLSDYDAFLLPNPYRLIIDIHGKNWNGRQRREAAESLMTQNSPHGAAAVGSDADSSSTETKLDASASSEPGTPVDTEPEAKTTQIGSRRHLGIGSTESDHRRGKESR